MFLIFLGGVAVGLCLSVVLIPMLFVSKWADENADEIFNNMKEGVVK